MCRTVIFYSPLGKNLSPDKIGGIESASHRTIQTLTNEGFRIIPLKKPVLNKRRSIYLIQLFYTWMKLLGLLLKNRAAILHVVGVYRELMYIEWLFIISAKILGHKTVYDIRNGDMIKEYEKRGGIYKRGMLSLLQHSDSVLCQGINYVHFIEKIISKSTFYFPNYLQDCFLSDGYPQRDMKQCRLVYFGRIVESKNIELILDIYTILYNRGMSLTLDLIGGCSDIYKNKLEIKMKKMGLPDGCIRFWGRTEFKVLIPYLKTCHFFLFPSNEAREGHSNSLTEAMGCGIVPVVSDAGFNRHVVGDDTLVIPDLKADIYADTVYRIWVNKNWETYSRKMYTRVVEYFSESCVRDTLLSAYQ